MRRYTVFVLALLVAGTAQAKRGEDVVKMTESEPVAAQVDRVKAALNSESYSEISQDDKGRVQQALGRIQQKMEGHTLSSELSPEDRTAVFNDQELVNTVMTKAKEDSRLVCRRERSTGSNMQQSVCTTVAQRRRATDNGRALLNEHQQFNNLNPGK
ncbi:hypothetical protein D3C87_305410 [compost metagenome]|nr:hypothetical protein [Stenotrophomonas sp.]HCV95847.1 hypothetical protein [Stenotrophomonas sp.]